MPKKESPNKHSAMRGKGTGSKEEGARASVREGRTTRARTQQVIQDEDVYTPETPAPSTLTRGTPMTSEAGASSAMGGVVLNDCLSRQGAYGCDAPEKISLSHVPFLHSGRLELFVSECRRGLHYPTVALQSRSETLAGGNVFLPGGQQERQNFESIQLKGT